MKNERARVEDGIFVFFVNTGFVKTRTTREKGNWEATAIGGGPVH